MENSFTFFSHLKVFLRLSNQKFFVTSILIVDKNKELEMILTLGNGSKNKKTIFLK